MNYLIGVCGPSCSGKTTICKKIAELNPNIKIISQDRYYKGGDNNTNYDIPTSLDSDRMASDLKKLKSGQAILAPLYNLITHTRKPETELIQPGLIILVEGILIFSQDIIRDLCDLKIYVSAYPELRYERRLKRDSTERHRSESEIRTRYFEHVLPAAHVFVEPAINFCDICLMNNTHDKFIGLDILLHHIEIKLPILSKITPKLINTRYIIGVCGATCSGKTTICREIAKINPNVVFISQDRYYHGGNQDTNYDIPKSINFPRMAEDIKKLISGYSIQAPIYDFKTHSQKLETDNLDPAKIIIIEGILIFTETIIRELCNLKIFVSAYPELRFYRRLKRDISERNRTELEVRTRYFNHVLPATKLYVDPSINFADISLMNNNENNFIGLDILLNHIQKIIEN